VGHDGGIALRLYERTDFDDFIALFGDSEVMRYIGEGKPLAASAAAELFAKIFDIYRNDRAFFIWAVYEGDRYAGHAELKRRKGRSEYEIVYMLQRSRWGRSLGGRLVNLLLFEAQKRGIPFIIATVNPQNSASLAILTRLGFMRDADLSASLCSETYRLNVSSSQAGGT
jgi:RimJ/RimL family protein N-acetyltransferase